MRSILFIYSLLMLLLFSCNRAETTADSGQENEISYGDSTAGYDDYHSTQAIWAMEFDTSDNKTYMRRLRDIEPDTPNAEYLITTLNKNWLQIPLKLLRTSGDTIYIRIRNSEFLTQQMGSSGAEAFMATVTYTLTEDPAIKYVNFAFKEGDHARPGTYNRNSFKYGLH